MKENSNEELFKEELGDVSSIVESTEELADTIQKQFNVNPKDINLEEIAEKFSSEKGKKELERILLKNITNPDTNKMVNSFSNLMKYVI